MPTFTDAQRLIDWMHAAYLSELLLRRASPKPSVISAPKSRGSVKVKPPADGVVTMEWGLVIPDQANTGRWARSATPVHYDGEQWYVWRFAELDPQLRRLWTPLREGATWAAGDERTVLRRAD